MSQYFPLDYRQIYSSELIQRPGQAKIVTQRRAADFRAVSIRVDSIDQMFSILSRICGKQFDISSILKLKAFLVLVQQQLTQRADLDAQASFFRFLRANQSSSLQFRFQCHFDVRSFFDDLAGLCASDGERQEICRCYKLGPVIRADMLLLNVLYHLMKFLQQFSAADKNLLELAKCYHQRSGEQHSVNPCGFRHAPRAAVETAPFAAIYNKLVKPFSQCKSAADVLRDITRISTLIAEFPPKGRVLKAFVVMLKVPLCDCRYDIVNFVASKSTEDIWKIVSREQLAGDDYRNLSQAYYKLMQEFIGLLCCLRTWLEARTADSGAEQQGIETLLLQELQGRNEENKESMERSERYEPGDCKEALCTDDLVLTSDANVQAYWPDSDHAFGAECRTDEIMELRQMCLSLLTKVDKLVDNEREAQAHIQRLERRVHCLEEAIDQQGGR